MADEFKALIAKVATGANLSRAEAASAFDRMMSGEATPSQMGGLLMALRVRGETVDEITGAVTTMRAKMLSVKAPPDAVDIVGTGGDASGSYNISTCAAFIVAGAGVPIAKHGNRAVTSQCGTADVLEALGVPIDLEPEQAVECLRETGFMFLFAPRYHPAMKAVGPLRRALGFRTIFNLCGPLTNPAGARTQVIGVLAPSKVLLVGRTLAELGAKRAFVVHGSDGIDELTTTGESVVARIVEVPGSPKPELKAARITPEMAGLERRKLEEFTGGDVATNASLLYDVLTGIPGARRDIVLLNAAAALVAAGLANDLKQGVQMGAEAIDGGEAAATLAKLRQFGTRYATKH